jgi:hypothetical protein
MKNQRQHFILFSILFLASTIAYPTAIDAGDDHVSTIPYDEFVIEGISIMSSYEEVTAALGEPVRVVKEIITGGPGLLVHYEGMDIVISDDEAVNITVTGAGYRMKNGLSVGSSRYEVFGRLGKAEVMKHNGREVVRYTVTTPQGGYADAQLIIYFEGDSVAEMVFYFAYV